MREDIIGAMKNAMERGATPQQTARSLINSGYPAQEVNEALSFITGGTLNSLTPQPRPPAFQRPSMMQPKSQQQYPQVPAQQRPQQYSTMQMQQKPNMQQLPVMKPQQIYQPKQESKGGLKTFLLFLSLLLLVGLLVAAILFKDKVLEFFG